MILSQIQLVKVRESVVLKRRALRLHFESLWNGSPYRICGARRPPNKKESRGLGSQMVDVLEKIANFFIFLYSVVFPTPLGHPNFAVPNPPTRPGVPSSPCVDPEFLGGDPKGDGPPGRTELLRCRKNAKKWQPQKWLFIWDGVRMVPVNEDA